jgi:hypothetical protein
MLGVVLMCDPAVGAISVCTIPWKLLYVRVANRVCCVDIRSVRQTLSFGCHYFRFRTIERSTLPEYDRASSSTFKFLS